ncbi:MAG: GrpB family protein [Oscillospiraceae bacterium]|nr:GrpB family protein [Oscillospiraceae bacterium]
MLGLKRGTVALSEHQNSWHGDAARAIGLLKGVLSDAAIDIQHVGSTAIVGIHAKPIIDIAVGVTSLNAVMPHIPSLEKHGIIYRKQDVEGQMLFVMGDFEKNIRTHHIHVVLWNSTPWQDYVNFRAYLNAFPEKARSYDDLKCSLAVKFAQDRGSYTQAKQELIAKLLAEAAFWRKNISLNP